MKGNSPGNHNPAQTCSPSFFWASKETSGDHSSGAGMEQRHDMPTQAPFLTLELCTISAATDTSVL